MFRAWLLQYGLVLAIASAALGWAGVGVQQVRIANVREELATEKAGRASDLAVISAQTTAKIAAFRADEDKINAVILEALNDEREKTTSLSVQLRAGFDASERLRQRATTLAAGCNRGAESKGPAESVQTATPPGDLLSDMLRRMDEAGREISEYADRARIAGEAAERIYGASVKNDDAK